MGAAQSTPPQLVEVNAPGGKILVPPGTGFTVHPPGVRGDMYGRGPVFFPASSPPLRRRRGPAPRRARPDIDIVDESEESESTLAEMVEGTHPRRQKGMEGMMRRRGRFEGWSRSMPGMAFPGMGRVGMMETGMSSPRMGSMGMGGMVPGGIGSGGMAMMGEGVPPEYGPHPLIPPRFTSRPADMPGGVMNAYPSYAGPPPSPPLSKIGQKSPHAPDYFSRRPPASQQYIPMGPYAAKSDERRQFSRSQTEPQASRRLNCGQAIDQKVGPSGKEWIEGDSFLDACICTTACKCRKSQRVLYRSRKDANQGFESGDDGPEYGSGEIRYILKDDLGRDCGDHSRCKRSDSESEKEEKKRKKKKKKKEEKDRKEQLAGFKEELLEALDERVQDIKKESQRAKVGSSPGPPFSAHAMGPGAFMMNDATINPRLAQQMGMGMSRDPYGIAPPNMGRMPPGMTDAMAGTQMAPMGRTGMAFEDDVSLEDVNGMRAMGLENPFIKSRATNRKPMGTEFLSPHRIRRGASFGPGGFGLDTDTGLTAAMYRRESRTRGRGGMMGNYGAGSGGRQARPGWESDEFDAGASRRRGTARRGVHDDDNNNDNDVEDEDGLGSIPRGGFGVEDDDGLPVIRRCTQSPHRGRPGPKTSRNREKQARVDTDDDDAY